MEPVRAIAAAVLLLIGGLLLVPLARVWLTHERTDGEVIEVLAGPMAPDGTRIATVAYQFLVPGDGVRRQLAYAQRDGLFRPVPDPALSAEGLDAVRRSLGLGPAGGSRQVRVFYRANDPAGTAFIPGVAEEHRSRRYAVGLAFIFAGIAGMWFAREASASGTGAWTRSFRRRS